MSRKCFALSQFYRMPKFLFEDDFKNLSNDARILYILLRDRSELSRRNKWMDKQGEVYLIYTRDDMGKMLGCSQPTVRRAIAQLKKAGLMGERCPMPNKPNYIYIYDTPADCGGKLTAACFYQLPKFLFEGNLKGLSNDAKVLYALLKDRLELSRRNKWMDKQGEVYLIYTRDDMGGMLGCSQPTVRKAMKQLKEANLIEERRQGVNKPNLIYLSHPSVDHSERVEADRPTAPNTFNRNERFFHSETDNSFTPKCKDLSLLDCKNVSVLYNNVINKTDISDTDNQSMERMTKPTKSDKKKNRMLVSQEEYEDCKELLKENIEYEALTHDNRYNRQELDEMLDIMAEAVCSSRDTIRVNREDKPAEVVKSRLLKLDSSHIEYVFDCLNDNTTKILNIRAYLLSALYNAPSTIHSYYRAAVNHDLYGGGNSYASRDWRVSDSDAAVRHAMYNDPRLYVIF